MATGPGATDKAEGKPDSDFDEVMKHVKAIREDFMALAAATGKLAASRAKEHREKASQFASEAADKAGSYRDDVADRVREHPLAAVGIAALAGVVLSSLKRR